MSLRPLALSLVVPLALLLAGCQATGDTSRSGGFFGSEGPASPPHPLDTKYYASDEPLKEGFRQFYAGNFGLSQKHFQAAVEKTPADATAWIGLAASYDRLRRFDLADEAYAVALQLSGPTVQLLNNRGYSYLLRGDLPAARAKFNKAYELAPDDPIINNNLVLLSSSYEIVRRHAPAYQ